MKSNRQNKIYDIINTYNIETQDELASKLVEKGIRVTQATVSRDIRDLGIVKVMTRDGKYKYAVPSQGSGEDITVSAKFRKIIKETVLRVDNASNVVVIKTYPGMANAAGAAIDSFDWDQILGSIAGDDTVIVVLRTDDDAHEFVIRISDIVLNG